MRKMLVDNGGGQRIPTYQRVLVAIVLALSLFFGGITGGSQVPVVGKDVAAAHTGHYVGFNRHYISLYVYEQGYAIVQQNYFAPFCWGASTWIKTIDSRTGQRVKRDFKRCW